MNSQDIEYIKKCHYWNAVSNSGFQFKRFLRSSNLSDSSNDTQYQAETKLRSNSSGIETKKFYESVIQESISSKVPIKYEQPIKELSNKIKTIQNTIVKKNNKIEFDKKKFFHAATYNDLETLKSFIYKDDSVNTTDQYGWTALMMASCENSIEAVKFLLFQGANKTICDKQGNCALSLSKQKGHSELVNLLKTYDNDFNIMKKNLCKIDERNKIFKFFCLLCKNEFNVKSKKEHETSTIHLFNSKSEKNNFLRYSTISKDNRGLKLMVKQGWDRVSGLGAAQSGNLFPIKTVIRKTRSGLGIEQDSAKITHFKAYDLNAIKYKPPLKTKSRNDLRTEHRRNKKIERRIRNELA